MDTVSKKNKNLIYLILAAVALFLTAVVFVIVLFISYNREVTAGTEKTDGYLYIKAAEVQDTAAIEDRIFALNKNMMFQRLTEHPDQVFAALAEYDTVIIGDSRAVGFSDGFMDPGHVLSGVSWTIMEIPAVYDRVAAINPRVIVLSFGINELGPDDELLYVFPTPEIYAAATLEYVEQLRVIAPNAKIYVNSIIPVCDFVLSYAPRYGRIPEWNETMKPLFESAGVGFIDITDLCREHSDLYSYDGIHFRHEFYPYWGAAILARVMDDETKNY